MSPDLSQFALISTLLMNWDGIRLRMEPISPELADELENRGLKVWLDERELVPGRPWQEALEEIVQPTKSAAVLVANDGIGPWQDREMWIGPAGGWIKRFISRFPRARAWPRRTHSRARSRPASPA